MTVFRYSRIIKAAAAPSPAAEATCFVMDLFYPQLRQKFLSSDYFLPPGEPGQPIESGGPEFYQ
ncbi:MAG: hypothetical protein E4H33_03635 [Anaerolineales bacterium]|nr:MAG: hypothetical protein E4H33_03635 [Anaerolineales bacterium]